MIPSQQESAEAISLAKDALEEYNRFFFGNAKIESELYDLGLLTAEERYMAIDVVLQEITPTDRKGPNPPNDITSYGSLRGERLVAFEAPAGLEAVDSWQVEVKHDHVVRRRVRHP